MEALVRIITGTLFGSLLTATGNENGSLTAGILIFAIGIVIGLVCVLVVDFIVRRRMRRDYRSWVAAGRPERRLGERRGMLFRRSAGGPRVP